MEIDGYAFYLGLKSLELSYKASPGLQSLIRLETYLIRGAIFRPKYATSSSGRFSLDIRPLGELIDMYHTHEATKLHDKVYALLGMSSNNHYHSFLKLTKVVERRNCLLQVNT